MADPLDPETLDDLAAEHAIGLLEGDDLARAIALQRSDPAFAAAVVGWQLRLAPLLNDASEAEPAGSAWDKVARSIKASARPDWPQRMRRWRGAALVSGALAASLAALALIGSPDAHRGPERPPVAEPVPRHIAQLVKPDGTPLLAIAYDAGTGTMKVGPAALGDAERVPELWIIPEGGVPHSLGELTRAGSTRVVGQAELQRLVRDGATLAITLEERASIPHLAPTSAIIASGTLTSI